LFDGYIRPKNHRTGVSYGALSAVGPERLLRVLLLRPALGKHPLRHHYLMPPPKYMREAYVCGKIIMPK